MPNLMRRLSNYWEATKKFGADNHHHLKTAAHALKAISYPLAPSHTTISLGFGTTASILAATCKTINGRQLAW